jgi:DNA primase
MNITDLLPNLKGKPPELYGPCPFCETGNDRFRVWPREGRDSIGKYWCRQCGTKGDAIDLLQQLHGLSYRDACNQLQVGTGARYFVGGNNQPVPVPVTRNPVTGVVTGAPVIKAPNETWQNKARALAETCEDRLWTPEGERARRWLMETRGLTEDAIRFASMGFNPAPIREPLTEWGYEEDDVFFADRGITIPWVIDGLIWRLNVRRSKGDPRYMSATKSVGRALYNADLITEGVPVMIVEGEIDALTVLQAAGDLCRVVATGSTQGAHHPRWLARLTAAPAILVAFDNEQAGDDASLYWLHAMPKKAARWRPYWKDANQMLKDGADVREWVAAGLEHVGIRTANTPKQL